MIDTLLDRLEMVTGRDGRYTARCPSHPDTSPSLSITEVQDGKILVHCHAGCGAGDVVNAVGLDLRDLFPESTMTPAQKRRYRKQKSRTELESAFHHELLVLVQVVGNRVTDRQVARYFSEQQPGWRSMPDEAWDRELLAVSRIRAGMEKLYG